MTIGSIVSQFASAVFSSWSWLRRKGLLEVTVMSGFFIIAASLWLFIEIADEVHEGETQHFDNSILRLLRTSGQGLPIGPPWLEHAARDVTALGSTAVITIVSVATAGFFALTRKWGAFWLVIASVTSGSLVSTVLKLGFERQRPEISLHLTQASSLSFPSGHSMLSAVTYLTLGALLARTAANRRIKAYFLSIAAFLAFIVGLTRIYLGVHFPTDVLAGWCAGTAWAVLCSLIARWLERKGAVEREDAV